MKILVMRYRAGLLKDWTDVHGLDFSPLKSAAISKGFLRTPDSSSVVTDSICVIDLDLQSVQITDSSLQSLPFRLTAKRDDTVHAFLAWFDYEFNFGVDPVHISTGPFNLPTHWKQTVFYLQHPIHARRGEVVTGEVSFEQYQRDLNVRFNYEFHPTVTNGVKIGVDFQNGAGNGYSNGVENGTKKNPHPGFGQYKV